MENKSTKRKSDHKISDTVGKIVIIIIVLLFIFLLPDLIYNIRVIITNRNFKKNCNTGFR